MDSTQPAHILAEEHPQAVGLAAMAVRYLNTVGVDARLTEENSPSALVAASRLIAALTAAPRRPLVRHADGSFTATDGPLMGGAA